MINYKNILIALFVISSSTMRAQFFKKLIKKAEKAIEQKTEDETNRSFNDNPNTKKSSKTKEFKFDYKYILEYKTKKRTTPITHYLPTSGNYIGTMVKGNEEVKTVLDFDDETMYMFMDNNNSKTLVKQKLRLKKMRDDAVNNVQISPTGNTKQILNYNCKEYLVEGDGYKGTVWTTTEIQVAIFKDFYKIKKSKNAFMTKIKGLLMEASITDTSSRKQKTTHIKCTELKNVNMVIEGKEYKSIF